MTRRVAMAAAGAITIVLLAATAVIAANLGLLRAATDSGSVGRLDWTDLAPAATVQKVSPKGATADSQDGGSVRAYEECSEDEQASNDQAGDDTAGRNHEDRGQAQQHERYEGREDDD